MTSTGFLILFVGVLLLAWAIVPEISRRVRGDGKPRIFYGWYLLGTFFFMAMLTMGARNAFGIFVIPMSEEFNWSRGTISLAAALGALVNGVTQPFMGRIFDRTGGRKLIIGGLAVIGVITALHSLTFHIFFLIFMFGFVLSTAMSASSINTTGAMLARWFRRRRAVVMGINASGTSAGALLLVPFAMYLLQATHWRVTWAVLGLIVLMLAVPLAYLFVKEWPSDLGLQPDGDADPLRDRQGNLPPQRREGPLASDNWKQSFRSMPFWQMSLSYYVCGSTTFMLTVHFIPYAIGRGVSPTLAATVFGLMMGLNAAGAIGAGWLADRFSRKNLLAGVYFCRGCGYMLLLLVPGDASLWAFAIVAGFSWIATAPLTTTLTADVYGLRTLGTVSGASFVFHQVGGFVSVWVAGILFDVTGSYTIPFAIMGSLLFPAALSAFSIRERKYSSRYQTAPVMATAAGD